MNDYFAQVQEFLPGFYEWLSSSGIKILIILFIAFIVRRFSGFFIEKGIRKAVVPDRFASKTAEEKRENTLIRISSGTVGILIWLVTAMMILSEFGVDIGPLIAAAGVIGLAFGFGGQYLIRDIIAGLFFIFENQFRVGDVVCLGGTTCGKVEDITLRTTTLRDLDGRVHHVPHGEVPFVSNMSKEFSRVNLDIGISYNDDIEKAIEVINRVGEELAHDSEWSDKINKAPQFLRVQELADSSVILKILGETKPGEKRSVTGELMKRLKITFDQEGIEIPFPQRVIHNAKK